MNFDDARRIERVPVKIGEQCEFYATVQQEYEPTEKRLRNYTGQLVTVVAWENEDEWREQEAQIEEEIAAGEHKDEEPERDVEPTYKVRAKDGFEFSAYESELNDWHKDTGQFFWPDATWGPEHDDFALVNEDESRE